MARPERTIQIYLAYVQSHDEHSVYRVMLSITMWLLLYKPGIHIRCGIGSKFATMNDR